MKKKARIVALEELLNVVKVDNGEEFVVLNGLSPNIICQYEKFDMERFLGDKILVRKTVAEKLIKVATRLIVENPNYKLKVVYGYRHPYVQQKYFFRKKNALSEKNKNCTDNELNRMTHMFVAYPPLAGHPTGGAVDVTITTDKEDLDMGTRIADFSNEDKIQTFYPGLTKKEEENRMLLHDLMVMEDFAPFYGEWWHFSYGDIEWANFYKKETTFYGQKRKIHLL